MFEDFYLEAYFYIELNGTSQSKCAKELGLLFVEVRVS
jgi:hypothetical protein